VVSARFRILVSGFLFHYNMSERGSRARSDHFINNLLVAELKILPSDSRLRRAYRYLVIALLKGNWEQYEVWISARVLGPRQDAANLAILGGNLKIVQHLLDPAALILYPMESYITTAATHGRTDILHYLLLKAKKLDLLLDYQNAFQHAIDAGFLDTAKRFAEEQPARLDLCMLNWDMCIKRNHLATIHWLVTQSGIVVENPVENPLSFLIGAITICPPRPFLDLLLELAILTKSVAYVHKTLFHKAVEKGWSILDALEAKSCVFTTKQEHDQGLHKILGRDDIEMFLWLFEHPSTRLFMWHWSLDDVLLRKCPKIGEYLFTIGWNVQDWKKHDIVDKMMILRLEREERAVQLTAQITQEYDLCPDVSHLVTFYCVGTDGRYGKEFTLARRRFPHPN